MSTHLFNQILGVTADNTLNHDSMICYLHDLLDAFPGPSNQTRCFLRILNITAKAIIKQFDVPKEKDDTVMDQAVLALASMEEGLEKEELEAWEDQDCEDDEVDNPPLERWVDLHNGLSKEELDEIRVSIWPVQSMLTKVRVVLVKSLSRADFTYGTPVVQVCIRSEKIVHHPPSTLVQEDAWLLWSPLLYDAPRCLNSLEFNL